MVPKIMDDIKTKFDAQYESKIKELEDKIFVLEDKSCALEGKSHTLEAKLLVLERKSKECDNRNFISERRYFNRHILIKGIPSNINFGDKCNIIDIAKMIGFNDLTNFDVDYSLRFKVKSESITSPCVLVAFASQSVKEHFMYMYLKYIKNNDLTLHCFNQNLPNTKIYINNHYDAKTYNLLSRARLLKHFR